MLKLVKSVYFAQEKLCFASIKNYLKLDKFHTY